MVVLDDDDEDAVVSLAPGNISAMPLHNGWKLVCGGCCRSWGSIWWLAGAMPLCRYPVADPRSCLLTGDDQAVQVVDSWRQQPGQPVATDYEGEDALGAASCATHADWQGQLHVRGLLRVLLRSDRLTLMAAEGGTGPAAAADAAGAAPPSGACL